MTVRIDLDVYPGPSRQKATDSLIISQDPVTPVAEETTVNPSVKPVKPGVIVKPVVPTVRPVAPRIRFGATESRPVIHDIKSYFT